MPDIATRPRMQPQGLTCGCSFAPAGLCLNITDRVIFFQASVTERPIALPPVWLSERVMLTNVSEEIRECYRHAEDCARQAAAQTDPNLKKDFLLLEERWLCLARSYEFGERLTHFANEAKRKLDNLPNSSRR